MKYYCGDIPFFFHDALEFLLFLDEHISCFKVLTKISQM